MQETSNFAKRKFLYRLSRSDYERQWGKTYTKPNFGTHVISALLQYMPKVGPLKGLGFDNPTAQTENLYITSINATVDSYLALLEQVRAGTLALPNCDLDDGMTTKAAEYTLADEAYASLLPSCPPVSSMPLRPSCAPTSSHSIPIFRFQSTQGRMRLAGKSS